MGVRVGTKLRQSLAVLGCADLHKISVFSESINGIQRKSFYFSTSSLTFLSLKSEISPLEIWFLDSRKMY